MTPATKLAKKKPKSAVRAKKPLAFHGKTNDGKNHVVGIGNLRAVIVQDNAHWFAQGLEIDYAAEGSSLDDVKKQFEDGLLATVEQHLKTYGGIEHLLCVAPSEAWAPLLKDPEAYRGFLHSAVSTRVCA